MIEIIDKNHIYVNVKKYSIKFHFHNFHIVRKLMGWFDFMRFKYCQALGPLLGPGQGPSQGQCLSQSFCQDTILSLTLLSRSGPDHVEVKLSKNWDQEFEQK